jgi:hypothetical protein
MVLICVFSHALRRALKPARPAGKVIEVLIYADEKGLKASWDVAYRSHKILLMRYVLATQHKISFRRQNRCILRVIRLASVSAAAPTLLH